MAFRQADFVGKLNEWVATESAKPAAKAVAAERFLALRRTLDEFGDVISGLGSRGIAQCSCIHLHGNDMRFSLGFTTFFCSGGQSSFVDNFVRRDLLKRTSRRWSHGLTPAFFVVCRLSGKDLRHRWRAKVLLECLCSTGPQGYDLQKIYRENWVNVSAFVLDGDSPPNSFRMTGDHWEICFQKTRFVLSDAIGMGYLAEFLSGPGKTLNPVELENARTGIATATPAVIISKVRTENRIGCRGASLVGLALIGSHGRAMQNIAEAIADQSGTFHSSGDGRLWSELVHA